MSQIVYRIKDWDVHFENAKSRERETCSYVCVPNKQHGMSFSKLMLEKDGGNIYGTWHLMVGACSQQRRPREGWMTNDGKPTGTPWTVEDLSVKFRRPDSEITRALEVLTSPRIAWIETYQINVAPAASPNEKAVITLVPIGATQEETEKKIAEKKDKDERNEKARQVLAYLNEKVGSNFKFVRTNLDLIAARLKESCLEDCTKVIDIKFKEWGHDTKMKQYLRPETLFKASHFHSYLGGAGAAPEREGF